MSSIQAPDQNLSTIYKCESAPADPIFHEALRSDSNLSGWLKTWVQSLKKQLDQIEDLYLYDELEKGDVLEELSEREVKLPLKEAVHLIRILTRHSFFKHQLIKIQKICQGHTDRFITERIREDHLKDEKNKLTEKCNGDKNIKEFKVYDTEEPRLIRIPFLQSKLYNLHLDYTHVDNVPSCHQYKLIKTSETKDKSFEEVLKLFESKLKEYRLDAKHQWAILVQQVFGKNLKLM